MNENQEQEPMIEEQSLPTLSIKEAELPVVNATDVKEIRVVNNMDESRSVSIVEARKALAVNPSTTEQATGETFDGKPVYVRLIKAITPEQGYVAIVASNIAALISVEGGVYYNSTSIMPWATITSSSATNCAITMDNSSITVYSVPGSSLVANKPYFLIVQYTKL